METTYESDEKLFGYIVFSNRFKDKYDPIIIYPSARSIGSNTDINLPNQLLNQFKYLIDEGYAYPFETLLEKCNNIRSLNTTKNISKKILSIIKQ